jgi:hypothetical protein
MGLDERAFANDKEPWMNIPRPKIRLVIVGATGMVGGYVLRYALEHPAIESVTAIVRRSLGVSHPRLKEVLHRDFADCSALADALTGQDAAAFCLGAYTGSVSDAELRAVTVDYTMEFARVPNPFVIPEARTRVPDATGSIFDAALDTTMSLRLPFSPKGPPTRR